MSLLLKALEKSEAEKKAAAPAKPAAGAPAPAGAAAPAAPPSRTAAPVAKPGGFKLASGGPGLAKPKAAAKVVAAYGPAGEEHDDEHHEEAAAHASRRSRTRKLVLAVVGVAAAGGGYFAYENFLKQMLFPEDFIQTSGGDAEQFGSLEDDSQAANLLPLPEPIYDIQEDILIASLGPDAGSPQGGINAQERELADRVSAVVSSIIEDQIEEERQRELLARVEDDVDIEEQEREEVEELLQQDFNFDDAEVVSSRRSVEEQLEEISVPYVNLDKTEFIKKSSFDLARVDENGEILSEEEFAARKADEAERLAQLEETVDDAAGGEEAEAAAAEEPPAAAEKPGPENSISMKRDSLNMLLEEGAAHYRRGDVKKAEENFRTVIAAHPSNVSALLAMAKIHEGRGNLRLAVATLLKASDYEHDNPDIISDLLAIQAGKVDLGISESSLIDLLGRVQDQNQEAKLFFYLGNIYARKVNWLQAKNAFFRAHQLNGDNPDYAYNYAVVLDYLGEEDEAARMYGAALSKAAVTPSTFDAGVARTRLAELEN